MCFLEEYQIFQYFLLALIQMKVMYNKICLKIIVNRTFKYPQVY
jgi:hypothetical protein